MSNQPTVAALATRAVSLIAGLTEEQARSFIRNNNIRSNTKLDSLVKEQLEGKSTDEIQALCAPAVAQRAEVATKKKPAAKTATKKAGAKEAKPKFEKQGRTKRTTAVNEGPRGFRFGPTWCNSVKEGSGIALLDINRPKLLKHAETMGVAQSVIDSGDPAKIAKSLAAKIEKAEAQAE